MKWSWLVLMGVVMFLGAGGCAGRQSHEAKWLKLPSPWSTIRQAANSDETPELAERE